MDNQRRCQLLQDIAIAFQHQPKEFARFVRYQVDQVIATLGGSLDRLCACPRSDNLAKWHRVDATHLTVGVRRGESVEMGTADGVGKAAVG
jgi:hypothetical protein